MLFHSTIFTEVSPIKLEDLPIPLFDAFFYPVPLSEAFFFLFKFSAVGQEHFE